MITLVFGTQNLSSFLCHRVDNGVSLIKCGRFKGCERKSDQVIPNGAGKPTSETSFFSTSRFVGINSLGPGRKNSGRLFGLSACESEIRLMNDKLCNLHLCDKSFVKLVYAVFGTVPRFSFPSIFGMYFCVFFYFSH
jgi:hypothetical protein